MKRAELFNPVPALPAGELRCNYFTSSNDLYASGLAACLRPAAVSVWEAIKSHSNFSTGRSYPSIRRLAEVCGIGKGSVEKAIRLLEEFHLLRVERKPRRNYYYPREMVFVWKDRKVVAAVSVQYVPCKTHVWLNAMKGKEDDASAREAWMHAELVDLSRLQVTSGRPSKEPEAEAEAEAEPTSEAVLSVKQQSLQHIKAYTDQFRSMRASGRA